MSREIKFRAYDAEENKMIILENSGLQYYDFEGSYSLGFTVDGYSGFWAHEQYKSLTQKAAKFPIMQFTGLKDKNGKEIYEGDICLAYQKLYEKPSPLTVKVIYNNEFARFEPVQYWSSGNWIALSGEFKSNYEFEVIGNIYQNPELLR